MYANPKFEFVTMGKFAGVGLILVLIGGGLIIGMGASVVVTRLLGHYLQGVHYLDPWTYSGVVLVGAGLAACFTPARRAAQVDPLQAIRCE